MLRPPRRSTTAHPAAVSAAPEDAFLVSLLANLFHGVVALVWVAGWRRAAGPVGAGMWANLLALGLVVPLGVSLLHAAGVVPVAPSLFAVRVERWFAVLAEAPLPVLAVLWTLLGGTVLLFLLQELLPAWRAHRAHAEGETVPDPRLDAALQRVLASYRAHGAWASGVPVPEVLRVESADVFAALRGIAAPRVLVSAPLLASLDDPELDAVLAHELAHHVRGGNGRLGLLWLVRALQATSPAALVLFRAFLEAEEAACDDVAARVTDRPAALASALIKSHGHEVVPAGAGRVARARAAVLRHADLVSTQQRVRRLIGSAPVPPARPLAGVVAALALGVLLWTIA